MLQNPKIVLLNEKRYFHKLIPENGIIHKSTPEKKDFYKIISEKLPFFIGYCTENVKICRIFLKTAKYVIFSKNSKICKISYFMYST